MAICFTDVASITMNLNLRFVGLYPVASAVASGDFEARDYEDDNKVSDLPV